MVKVERRHQLEIREGRKGHPSTHPTVNLTGGQQAHWKTAYVRALCKLSQDFVDRAGAAFTGSDAKHIRQLGQLATNSLSALVRHNKISREHAERLASALERGGHEGIYATAQLLDRFGFHFSVPVMRQLARGLNAIPAETPWADSSGEIIEVRRHRSIGPRDHPDDPTRPERPMVGTNPRMRAHHRAMDILHSADVFTDVFSKALPPSVRSAAILGPMFGRYPLDAYMRGRTPTEDITGLEPLIQLAYLETRLVDTPYDSPEREAMESQRRTLTAALPQQLDRAQFLEAARADRRYQRLDNASLATTATLFPKMPLVNHFLQGVVSAVQQPQQWQELSQGAQPDRVVTGGRGADIPDSLIGQPLTEEVVQQLSERGVTEVATRPASIIQNIKERLRPLVDSTDVARAAYRTQSYTGIQAAGLRAQSGIRARLAIGGPAQASTVAAGPTAQAVQRVERATGRVARFAQKVGSTRVARTAQRAWNSLSGVRRHGARAGRAAGRAARWAGRPLGLASRVARSPWVMPIAATVEGVQGYRYMTGRRLEEVERTDQVRYRMWAREYAELTAGSRSADSSLPGAMGGALVDTARGFFIDPAHLRARMHDSAFTHWIASFWGLDEELRQEKAEFFNDLARIDEDLPYVTAFNQYTAVMPQMFPALEEWEDGHLLANHIAAQAAHRHIARQRGELPSDYSMGELEDVVVYGLLELERPEQQRTMKNLLDLMGPEAFRALFLSSDGEGNIIVSETAVGLANRPGFPASEFGLGIQELTSPYEHERQAQAQAEADAEPDDPRSEREIREEAWVSEMEGEGEEHREGLRGAYQEWAQEQQRRADEMREHRQRLQQREDAHDAQIRSMYEKGLSQQADRWARQDEAHAAQMAATRSRFDDLMARSAPTPPVDSVPSPGQTMPEAPSMARPTFDMRSTLQDLKHKGVIHG